MPEEKDPNIIIDSSSILGIEKENYVLVLDDLRARQTAKKLKLKITVLLGILVKAKKRKKSQKLNLYWKY